MSSKLSGPQRRKLQFSMTNAGSAGELERDDARRASGLGDREDNLKRQAEYEDPTRQAAIAASNVVSRDAWNNLISSQAGRRLFVKASGFQRIFDGQQGHGGNVG